jgi:autotransporter-associated beta strand protein
LTKQGAGTLTLGGVNAQTGTTRIEAGVLAVANDGNLGAAGATLQFAGGTLAPTAGLTTNRPVEVSTGGGTLNTNGFDSTLSGAYSGTGSLTKDGVGTLSLTGTSTNTAAMNVNEGTLRGNTDSLKGNVVLANVSNLAFDQSTDGTYTKSVSGEGQLTKEGDGVLTVQGTHTYIGDTVISGGTLKLAVNPGFRYYRFQVTSNVNSDLSQQSEIGFFSSGTNPSNGTRVFATSVIGDGGDNGDGGWAALNDNDLNTKATYNGLPGLRYVTFDFGTAFAATGYDWATANDSTPDRNPNNWTVSASNDNSTYTLIDTQIGQGTNPTNTFTWAAGWALSLGGGGAGTNKLPVGTTVRMASGTTLNLNNVDQQVAALADASGSPTGHVVQLAGATLAIGDGGSAETTFNGDIIGSGTDAVVKNGTSVQNLNGAQQYDHLTVSGGTLNVNGEIGTDPANGTASVTVTGAGTSLKFGSVSQTLSTLTIGDGATLTFGSGAASGAFSGGGFKGASIGGGSVVPEPGTIGLLLVGAIGVLNRRRRQG